MLKLSLLLGVFAIALVAAAPVPTDVPRAKRPSNMKIFSSDERAALIAAHKNNSEHQWQRRPENVSRYSKNFINSTELAIKNANGDTKTLERIARNFHRRLNHRPSVEPIGFGRGGFVVILEWDTDDTEAYDFDLVVMDPTGCVASAKDHTGGLCFYDPGFTILGGELNGIVYTPYPYDQGNQYWYDPPMDSRADVNPPGAEIVLIWNPMADADYKVVSYVYDGMDGYAESMSARVEGWYSNYDHNGWPEVVASYYIYDTPLYGNDCSGRFWNVFWVSFTRSVDDDYSIAGYHITTIMSLSATPLLGLGTTDWFDWEATPRTNQYCDSWNYYYWMFHIPYGG